MQSLFEPDAKKSVLERLGALSPSSERRWGRMDVGQMLAHCSAALAVATGDTPRKQSFVGKVFSPFARPMCFNDKPFTKNSPTDPKFVVTDPRDFARERERLVALVERFCAAGPEAAGNQTHAFLGRITGPEWGVTMYKHLDHHLGQFGA